jgi:hypothetical protein
MPAYTTIVCEFSKRDRGELVSRFYAAFLSKGVAFDGVFPWGCEPNMTLREIVDWNQAKLDSDFSLGYTQDVSHDYRQIVLKVRTFRKCRLFLINGKTSIEFHCIVPENEITMRNCQPFLDASLRAWSQLPVKAIESYGESDANVGSAAINAGTPPSMRLFAIVDHEVCKHGYSSDLDITKLDRGYLLKPR